MRRTNLLLVSSHDEFHRPTFERVAEHLGRVAPDIVPEVVWKHRSSRRALLRALRRTFIFSPVAVDHFRFLRGTLRQGRNLAKSEEYRILERHGVPVPRWTLLRPDEPPDLAAFGPYVVVKPDRGGRGGDIKIKRRGRVRWRPPPDPVIPGENALLVQEFVYTGPWPVSFRVSSLFGEPLHALRVEASHGRRPLRSRDDFRAQGGVSIVATRQDGTWTLARDEEVLALARRAHAAMPEIPLLGVDVVRDADTGRLQVLEVNASGWTWHFTTRIAKNLRSRFGLDLEGQFGGLRRAAEVLAQVARRDAR